MLTRAGDDSYRLLCEAEEVGAAMVTAIPRQSHRKAFVRGAQLRESKFSVDANLRDGYDRLLRAIVPKSRPMKLRHNVNSARHRSD